MLTPALHFPLRAHPMQGVTLLELMVVLVVAAILYAIAAPSFSLMMANSRVRTAGAGILSGLQLARTEAIRRNAEVQFTLGSGGGWSVNTVTPSALVQAVGAGESGSRLQISSLNNKMTLTFNALGAVKNYDPAANLSRVTIAPPAGTGAISLQVDLFAGGQTRLCNPGITTADDPRAC